MVKKTKNGFSLIEIIFTLGLVSMLTTAATSVLANTQEISKTVTTQNIVEVEAENAIKVIANEGINHANLYITKDYVSDLNSNITIRPTVCKNNGVGHVITIQEANADYINRFDTCNFNDNFKFTMIKA
jgi:prepilin-type N-terminal cleavage/methylation domain-containing protein